MRGKIIENYAVKCGECACVKFIRENSFGCAVEKVKGHGWMIDIDKGWLCPRCTNIFKSDIIKEKEDDWDGIGDGTGRIE